MRYKFTCLLSLLLGPLISLLSLADSFCFEGVTNDAFKHDCRELLVREVEGKGPLLSTVWKMRTSFVKDLSISMNKPGLTHWSVSLKSCEIGFKIISSEDFTFDRWKVVENAIKVLYESCVAAKGEIGLANTFMRDRIFGSTVYILYRTQPPMFASHPAGSGLTETKALLREHFPSIRAPSNPPSTILAKARRICSFCVPRRGSISTTQKEICHSLCDGLYGGCNAAALAAIAEGHKYLGLILATIAATIQGGGKALATYCAAGRPETSEPHSPSGSDTSRSNRLSTGRQASAGIRTLAGAIQPPQAMGQHSPSGSRSLRSRIFSTRRRPSTGHESQPDIGLGLTDVHPRSIDMGLGEEYSALQPLDLRSTLSNGAWPKYSPTKGVKLRKRDGFGEEKLRRARGKAAAVSTEGEGGNGGIGRLW